MKVIDVGWRMVVVVDGWEKVNRGGEMSVLILVS